MVLVLGTQEEKFRWVWSLSSCHPIKGNCHTVLQLCTSLPALPGPKEQSRSDSCTATAHTQQLWGHQTGHNPPTAGSAAVERGSAALVAHLQSLQAAATNTARALHTWAKPWSCCPQPLPRAPPFSQSCSAQPPAHQVSPLPLPLIHPTTREHSSPCLTHTPPREMLAHAGSCTFPNHQQKQGCHIAQR